MTSGSSRGRSTAARWRAACPTPAALVPAVVVLLAGCSGVVVGTTVPTGTASAAGTSVAGTSVAGTSVAGTSVAGRPAVEVLAGLAVKGRAPKTGYRRDLFGEGWADLDRDGCSTREEVLQRDLTQVERRRSARCDVVVSGVLADPYSGRRIDFSRGASTSALVQVDHVVAAGDAWQKGAQQLDARQRVAFFNDPLNLLAVDGRLNQAKGDSDAATWLPPAAGARCGYVARQVAVKARYGLWVTAAEKAAVARILATCPGQRVPAG